MRGRKLAALGLLLSGLAGHLLLINFQQASYVFRVLVDPELFKDLFFTVSAVNVVITLRLTVYIFTHLFFRVTIYSAAFTHNTVYYQRSLFTPLGGGGRGCL